MKSLSLAIRQWRNSSPNFHYLPSIHYWPRHLLSPTLSLLLHWWHVKLNKSGGTGVGYLKLHLYHRNQLSLPLGSQNHLVFNCICFVQRLANLAEGGIFCQGPLLCVRCRRSPLPWDWTWPVFHHLWIDFVVALTSLKDEIQKKRRYKAKIQRSHNYSTSIQGPPLHPLVCSEYSSPLPRVYLGLPRVYLGLPRVYLGFTSGERASKSSTG